MPKRRTAEEAEAAFYSAFAEGNFSDMMRVWAPAKDIICVHPLGPRLSGHGPIAASWRQILAHDGPRDFEPRVITRQTGDTLSVHIVDEVISIPGSRMQIKPVIATNAYRLIDDEWFIVLHHASIDAREETRASAEPSSTRH